MIRNWDTPLSHNERWRIYFGDMMPKRVQLKRAKGWRKPDNTVVVSRPGKWGNPFPVADFQDCDNPNAMAVAAFKKWLYEPAQEEYRQTVRQELCGKNLACWCKPGQPCHADVLLELANA